MNWLVIYTKANFEIKVAETLNKIGVKAYCPVFKIIKQYSDRKKKIDKPLLPSYVLVKIKNEERLKVFDIPGVIKYVYWLGKPVEVKDKEIIIMENYLSEIYDSVEIERLDKGSTYNIVKGPFKGQTGKIVSLLKNKIKLELQSLGIIVTLRTA